jgi:hypothetical protein
VCSVIGRKVIKSFKEEKKTIASANVERIVCVCNKKSEKMQKKSFKISILFKVASKLCDKLFMRYISLKFHD